MQRPDQSTAGKNISDDDNMHEHFVPLTHCIKYRCKRFGSNQASVGSTRHNEACYTSERSMAN